MQSRVRDMYKFNRMIGNFGKVSLIRKSLIKGTFDKFSIFEGEPGTGKSSIAKVIAMFLTCESEDKNTTGEPCLKCPTCQANLRALEDGNFRGKVHYIDLGRKEDNIENMIIELFKLKSDGDVYILDEAHNLTRQEQTALLIELENNTNNYIMMCSSRSHTMLKELIERATSFRFSILGMEESKLLANRVIAEGEYRITAQVRDLILNYSEGVPRKIIKLIDFIANSEPTIKEIEELLGIINSDVYFEILDASMTDLGTYRTVLMEYANKYGAKNLVNGFREFIINAIFRLEGSVMDKLGNKGYQVLVNIGYDKLSQILVLLDSYRKEDIKTIDVLGLGLRIQNILRERTMTSIVANKNKDGVKQGLEASLVVRTMKEDESRESLSSKIFTNKLSENDIDSL